MTIARPDQSVTEGRIAELTLRFMTRLPVRLASIGRSLAALEANTVGALEELERQLHALAGTAGTYGVAEIASLAAQAEAICSSAQGRVDRQSSRILRGLITVMEASVSAYSSTSAHSVDQHLRRDCEPTPITVSSLAVTQYDAQSDDGQQRADVAARLAEREETLQRLLLIAFDGILIHDLEKIVEVSSSCAQMFRYEIGEMIGMPLRKLLDPSCSDALWTNVRAGVNRQELRCRRSDGTAFEVEMSGATIGNEGRQVVAIHDISERKAVIESELRYRELLETSHDLNCEHDLEGRVLSMDPLSVRLLEIPPEELDAVNIRDLIVPEHRAAIDDYLDTIRANSVAEGLMKVRTRSGRVRIWHYQNTLLRNNLDRPIVRSRSRDVTDREEALQALNHSERRFQSIIENASDIIAILDPSGTFAYHSPAAERVLGYGPGELVGRHYLDVVHPDERVIAMEFFARQMNEPRLIQTNDFRARHRDGSWRSLSVTASSIVVGGNVQSVIVNARDITDRRLLEAQLEQAHRLTSLGRLTATVAHEFNNVLMGMQPFADLMQRPGISPEIFARGARHIANSIARGKRIAMDMLRFTRPAEPTMSRIELCEWWDRFAPELLATTGDNIEVTWSFPPALAVEADAAQLSQVFSNLTSNARDAMPRGGKLSIRVRVPRNSETFSFGVVPGAHNFVQISVTDTGIGMPENVLRHAFDPLFTTKQNSGTGLGLAVAHQVVTKHAGFIFAESAVGVGTAFHIFLPRAGDCPHEQVAEQTEPAVKLRRVLLIEDEPGIREGVSEALIDRGMIVEAVGTGREALPALKRFAPQLAIIDIRLPDLDGAEVGRMLRRHDTSLKIIFASGHGDVSDVLDECAPATFLQKPFEMRELLEAIASLEREETQ